MPFRTFLWSWMYSDQRRLCPYVGLIGVSGGTRQSYVVWSRRRPSARGHQGSLPMHAGTPVSSMEIARAMTPSHSLGQVRLDRSTAIHYPCRTRSGPVQGRNALGGNTGSELVPPESAGPDRRSQSRSIGHTPCIAHHDVETSVDVSEPRSQSLGLGGRDPQPEHIPCRLKSVMRGFRTGVGGRR
jgi:hypothetical protein